jgi:hypothetical protein
LAVLATQINADDIERGVIGEDHVIYGRSPDDLAILIPMPDKIRELRDQVFAGDSSLGPQTPGSAEEKMRAEAPRILISNGSSDASLAGRAQTFLSGLGANIVSASPGNASGQTVLVDHTGSPYTLAYLAQLLNVPSTRIIHEFDPNAAVDVEIRLGSDAINAIP